MMIRRYRTPLLLLAALLLAGVFAWGQEGPQIKHLSHGFAFSGQGGAVWVGGPGEFFGLQGGNFTFINAEVGFDSKTVKGVPVSADAVTEFTQTLSNGQHIYRKSSTAIFRDSEGRTRKEQSIAAVGPYVSSGPARQAIFINDPVAGMSYSLNPEDRTAIRTTVSLDGVDAAVAHKVSVFHGESGTTEVKVTEATTGAVAGGVFSKKVDAVRIVKPEGITAHADSNARTESLGVQVIAGVQAEGKRSTVTIPAGSIGNDSPIDIAEEVWYSSELGMVVRSTRNDPLTGETVYQLTNIRRGEPPAYLFQVPADYTIKDGGALKIQVIKPEVKK